MMILYSLYRPWGKPWTYQCYGKVCTFEGLYFVTTDRLIHNSEVNSWSLNSKCFISRMVHTMTSIDISVAIELSPISNCCLCQQLHTYVMYTYLLKSKTPHVCTYVTIYAENEMRAEKHLEIHSYVSTRKNCS